MDQVWQNFLMKAMPKKRAVFHMMIIFSADLTKEEESWIKRHAEFS
jgi:hypothetical protein